VWCGASSRATVVGCYVDGVFSYTVLTPRRKARVAGWGVSLVASDVSKYGLDFYLDRCRRPFRTKE
jgi:hypothetical protein